MSVHFEQELEELKKKLLAMASYAEQNVARAVKAYTERDDDLARRVKEDDNILDQYEIDVDEAAITLLAKAPLASELRLITVGMKLAHDLERVGDEATTIARRALELSQEPVLQTIVDIPEMAGKGLAMLRGAIESFVHRDPAKARVLIPRDKEVDQMNKQLHRELASYMIEKPATITRCLHLMTISKALERIADHATNIAEEVVYLYEGRDIRHQPEIKHGPPASSKPFGT